MRSINIDKFLGKIEVVETRQKKKHGQTKKKDHYSENIDTIEIPPLESLDPLTKKLVKLGLVDLRDALKFQEEQKRQERPDIYTVFDYFNRVEELEQIRKVIEKAIEDAKAKKNVRMLRLPFYVFRDVVEDVTWADIERLAKELSEDLNMVVHADEGFLTVVLVSS